MNSVLIKTSSLILKISSIGFIIAACYHLLATFIVLNNSAVWRNLLFVFINFWCAFEIRKSKKYFIILFTGLFIQQLISHGNSVLQACMNNSIDWFDISVIIGITISYLAVAVKRATENNFQ
jgi:hypothetical protein